MSALTLDLTISGTVGKFTIEPVTVQYQISGQDAATGPKAIKVPAGAAPGSLSVIPEPMVTQNLLLLCTDEEVLYRLNGDGIDRTISKSGFAIHPGDPVITQLEFGGNGATDANVSMYQLGLAGVAPNVVGGALIVEPEQTAVSLQTIFNLTQTPADPAKVLFFIDGTMQSLTDFTVAGSVVTWTGAAFSGGERVNFVF